MQGAATVSAQSCRGRIAGRIKRLSIDADKSYSHQKFSLTGYNRGNFDENQDKNVV